MFYMGRGKVKKAKFVWFRVIKIDKTRLAPYSRMVRMLMRLPFTTNLLKSSRALAAKS